MSSSPTARSRWKIVLLWIMHYHAMASHTIFMNAFAFVPSPSSPIPSIQNGRKYPSYRYPNFHVSTTASSNDDGSSTKTTESPSSSYFDQPIFPGTINEEDTQTLPAKSGYDLILPDFDVVFGRICETSPLTKRVLDGRKLYYDKKKMQGEDIEGDGTIHVGGIDDIEKSEEMLNWKTTEKKTTKKSKQKSKPTGILEIDKIDQFRSLPCPLLRFRVRQRGPSALRGYAMAHLTTDKKARAKWDPNIDTVYECHTADNLMDVTLAMSRRKKNSSHNHGTKNDAVLDEEAINEIIHDYQKERFGKCTRFGIGYVRTKKNIVSPREQLICCGVQHFPESNSWIVFGVEMDDTYGHLFPKEEGEERLIRSKQHAFHLTIVPTSCEEEEDDGTLFDIEYGTFLWCYCFFWYCYVAKTPLLFDLNVVASIRHIIFAFVWCVNPAFTNIPFLLFPKSVPCTNLKNSK
mmetsp:Transcript_18536/g.26839  ORF Transcript_18536/g.26839 Transcript_18536/m.26839 type:complete len:461 (+) Transcript_18536:167-1549(+)